MDAMVAALDRAAEGAFLIDNNQRIIYWNRAAQEMLGYAPAEVLGRSCYDIVRGRDDHDHVWCRGNCAVTAKARVGQPIETFNTLATCKSGELRWINISILALQTSEDDSPVILHLFRDASELKQREQFARQVLNLVENMQQIQLPGPAASRSSALADSLTVRELDVLRLMAQGQSTDQIALALSISKSTTRNHIQNIHQKLQVHTRAQAVAYAFEHGLAN
ncbi:MAG TPA: LuxR C-terminal-related transcriptional regulator [Anaerolineae bacterium]|nr:LuxR C-terminal-related transcriptional regulator [Anaerolineae bacterium]